MFKNLQNIARFEQLQFKDMNISTFSTKLPILTIISATVIEILTFNKLSTSHQSVMLTTSLRNSWRSGHEIISAAVTQWRARLRVCVKVDEGHFEQFS